MFVESEMLCSGGEVNVVKENRPEDRQVDKQTAPSLHYLCFSQVFLCVFICTLL